MITVKQRLTARLAEQGWESTEEPHRTYAGVWQRREGSWSWGVQTTHRYVGSPVSMTNLLKCPHDWPGFVVRGTTDYEIHPCDECARRLASSSRDAS